MTMKSVRLAKLFHKIKPFLAVVFLQMGLAGMDILGKVALNEGMSNYVFVVYRHVVATLVMAPFAFVLDKKIRPKITASLFAKFLLLGLLEPVIDQNLYFLGMKLTTATFSAAMSNVLPAITFAIAWIFRLEKVKLTCIRSQAKIFGTLATIAGAMIMTLVCGPNLNLPWTKVGSAILHPQGEISLANAIKGALFIIIGMSSWACFMILQAVTLKTYPAELSLTVWICFLGAIEAIAVALVAEWGNPTAWAIKWNNSLFSAVYSGVFCSGIAIYIQGIIMQERGPVFVTAFSPLSMVIVAILSSFILSEIMYLGRLLGAVVIIVGLYIVVWGKEKDYDSPVEEPKLPIQINESAVDQNVECPKLKIMSPDAMEERS